MMYQLKALNVFICIIILVMEKVNCNDDTIQSKRYFKQEYVRQYNMNHPPPLPINGSYHKNKVNLPDKAIYCTIIPTVNTDRFSFLLKYFSSIAGKPVPYTNTMECVYPRSIEFPELGDEVPEPKLTPGEKLQKALLEDISNFQEFLDKVNKGEKPKPMKTFDVESFTDEIMNGIFYRKPDPNDIVDDSSPNGIICERIKFIESDKQGLEIFRPICYPAPRPPKPPRTTPRPTTTTAASDIYDKACYVLCHTGAIYQLLPCCRK